MRPLPHFLSVRTLFLSLALPLASVVSAADLTERPGWAVHETSKSYADLIQDVRAAVKDNGMAVVTQAGPTQAAAKRGITIPGNRVIGVFNNDFAVRILETSTAAMIEAPIRFYVTEDEDGHATLSYKTPSHVFAPYLPEGGDALRDMARDLDDRFSRIAAQAVK